MSTSTATAPAQVVKSTTDSFGKMLIYIVFTVLYIEIFLFLFNPKIKTHMLLCALVVTAISSIVLVGDTYSITEDKIKTSSFLPDWITKLPKSAPIALIIGISLLFTITGILFTTIIEYKAESKLSKKNIYKIETIKGIYISIIITAALVGLFSYCTLKDTNAINTTVLSELGTPSDTIKSAVPKVIGFFKNRSALIFGLVYIFSSSIYVLHESRKLYGLYVNDRFAE